MHARFLFGPAGSGKTFRCLEAIRDELVRSPEGPDLVLVAPKQATFQLERQLLENGAIQGYTRLHILSFERLAAYVLSRLNKPLPELLSGEGRVMVFRAILEEQHSQLRVFRASSRLAGFAQHLSSLVREVQQCCLSPDQLDALASKEELPPRLRDKLADLALIFRGYLSWMEWVGAERLDDPARLLDSAVTALQMHPDSLPIAGFWLDGFAEMTPQEHTLLAAVLPHAETATLAFCLQQAPRDEESWLSPWAVVSETARECHRRTAEIPGVNLNVETLARDPARSRFSKSPLLAQVERGLAGEVVTASDPDASLQLVECPHVEAEATLAARKLLGHVRQGGRFRECAILVRSLDGYQDVLRRVLKRYDIPFFLDRREPVAHHPLAELTRCALRVVAFDWRRPDWLGTLKTGLADLSDYEVDRLENATLARNWEGAALWLQSLPEDETLNHRDWLEEVRSRVVGPFDELHQTLRRLRGQPSGKQLACALRQLWSQLGVERHVEAWSQAQTGGTVHRTVLEQMNAWLDNLERAFGEVSLPLREWLQIIEAGLSGLTVGVIPPALDQVLVGSVDRSRNPDLKLVLVLGVNESVFPAPPRRLPLLSDADRADLETQGVRIGAGRRQFGHERYLGYIACTRAREQLVVTWSAANAKGHPQNPSRLVDDLERIVPGSKVKPFDGQTHWRDSEHSTELAVAMLKLPLVSGFDPLCELPGVCATFDRHHQVQAALSQFQLSAEVAEALYGRTLNLSVSTLEAFAACPFQFFAARGLRGEERDEFAVDNRRTGEFQHELLQEFHQRVRHSGKRWRELGPEQAVEWLREIGEAQLKAYRHGLFLATPGREFQARSLIANLERVITTLTEWARQNEFEPETVEASFGLPDGSWPAWVLKLPGDRALRIRGRVDRIDLCRLESGAVLVSILDYKSGGRTFDTLKFEHGLQLQMPAYLNAICENDAARDQFGATGLIPAGVFYVGLRIKPESGKSRADVIKEDDSTIAKACQHRGRFDESQLAQFDNRGVSTGDQFKYCFTKKGVLYKTGNDALPREAFIRLLESTTQQIRELGKRILSGEAEVSPYQKGSEVPCDWCRFRPVCRFDSWTQPYRPLKRMAVEHAAKEATCG